MKRTFTASIYFLLFLLIGFSYGVDAHKAIDKPTNELPNFVSPHLFDNFSKRLKTPLRTEENIITWSDAIAKGLPILKVGSTGMSYNDFMKKGSLDSVKIEEGGVDCIRYRISKAKDSIAIGEEFELTVTAEYIDNIPYTWQNKDCADFCIKVFMPEGFVQTGGDYRDFEGFSFRPEGLKRIERKIKGYFESKPQNNCFMLTKGPKFYDPQYLLEIKQNYCFNLLNKVLKNIIIPSNQTSLVIESIKNNYFEFKIFDTCPDRIVGCETESQIAPCSDGYSCTNTNTGLESSVIFSDMGTESGECKKPLCWFRCNTIDTHLSGNPALYPILSQLNATRINENVNILSVNNIPVSQNGGAVAGFYTGKNGSTEDEIYTESILRSFYFFANTSYNIRFEQASLAITNGATNKFKIEVGDKLFYSQNMSEPTTGSFIPVDLGPFQFSTSGYYVVKITGITESALAKYASYLLLDAFNIYIKNPQITTPTHDVSQVCTVNNNITINVSSLSIYKCSGIIEWDNGQTGPAISVSPSTTTIYKAKCKVYGCSSDWSSGITVNVSSETPTPIIESISCESRKLSSSCSCGTIRWTNPNNVIITGENTINVTVNGVYKVDCGNSSNQKTGTYNPYGVWGGSLYTVSCGNAIEGLVYNSLDGSITPNVVVTLTYGAEVFSREYSTTENGNNLGYKFFSMPYADFSTFVAGKIGTIKVEIAVKYGSCNISVSTPKYFCCSAGTISVVSNSPLPEGGTLTMNVTSGNMDLSTSTVSWTGPNDYSSSGTPATISNMTLAKAGTYNVSVSVNNCPNISDNKTIVVYECPKASNFTLTTNNNVVTTYYPTLNEKITLEGHFNITIPTSELTYQWRKNNGEPIGNATTNMYEIYPFNISHAGQYKVSVTRGTCEQYSKSVNISYGPCISVTVYANGLFTDSKIYAGTSILLSANISSEQTPTNLTYQWYKDGVIASGTSNLATYSADGPGTYKVIIGGTTCPIIIQDDILIKQENCPSIASLKVNNGEYDSYKPDLHSIVILSATINDATNVNYQWYKENAPTTILSTSSTFTISNYTSSNSGKYIVKITKVSSTCSDIKSVTLENPICPTVIADAWINSDNHYVKTVYAKVGDRLDYSASIGGGAYLWTITPTNTSLPSSTHTLRASAKTNLTMDDNARYSVKVNIDGCEITDYFDLVITCFDPIIGQAKVYNSGIDVGSDAIVSVGDNVSLYAPAITGASYTWTGPNGFLSYERNPSITGYMIQIKAGTYNLTVSKNGCDQYAHVTIIVGCSALTNANAYSNSPNCQVKTGETLHLWVDKEGTNYTYNWTGPANFQSTWRATGKDNVNSDYNGTYTVTVGYVGCTTTVTLTTYVCIFNCTLGTTVTKTCNTVTGTGSMTVTATGTTALREFSFYIQKRDDSGNFLPVAGYANWTTKNATPSYTFADVPSGIYRIYSKEIDVNNRVCEAPVMNYELKCDPCSFVNIDAVPSDKLVPAAVVSPIVLTANIHNITGESITVNSLAGFNWTGPNGIGGNTNTISTAIPGNYIVSYIATFNGSSTKTCTDAKTITLPPCTAPGVLVKDYNTSCIAGVNTVELITEGDFSNIEFSSDIQTWSNSSKIPLIGPANVDYKIYARSIDFKTCISEIITVTKTCDCVAQSVAAMKLPTVDCNLSGNTLKVGADFGSGAIVEYKIKKKDGTFETVFATNDTYSNISAGSYYVYARKQGAGTCYIQTMVEVSTKLPESPISYPCDINKNLSIGETSSTISVKTQKSWSGNALKLDGIKDFAETPAMSEFNGTAFTFETWAFPDPNASILLYGTVPATNLRNQRYLVQGKANGTRAFVSLSVGDNGINLIEETSTSNSKKVIFSKPINITNWVHIAVTYQAGVYYVFINGTTSDAISSTYSANGIDPPTFIGGSTDSFFKGKIDESRWWNIVKTDANIKAQMSLALVAPFPAELKRYYRYDQISGKTIVNAVASGTNDITLKNECNAFVDNTLPATGLELYPQFTWSNGSTGREITIPTPSVTTCYTVTMTSITGTTCSTQICVPIENCSDINVTVTPFATIQENTGIRPLLAANVINTAVLPEVSVNLETSMQMSGSDIINIGDYRYQDNTFTYEFWAKPTSSTTEVSDFSDPNASNNRHIIRPGYTTDGNKAGFGLTLGANGLVLYENGPGYMSTRIKYPATLYTAPNDPNDPNANWNHIAVVYDDGKPRLYVNGELVYSSNTQSPRRLIGITDMGRDNNTGFQGQIDELRIWNSARTAQEIKDNFNKAVLATEPNVGYWKFNRTSGNVIDSPTKIVKDESNHQRVLTLNSATVSTSVSTGKTKVNPKITWWLEKKNPTTGEITEEQVGAGSEYRMPLDLIKQGTYNYTVKFVKNDNTICKRTKTITVTGNTQPVTCFTILSDQNMNLISGNTGTNLKQTNSGISTDRIWKRTFRASDNSYYVFSSFNGAVWQNNNPSNPVTLVDGDPNNDNHRWVFEPDYTNGNYKIHSLANSNYILYLPNYGGDQQTIISGYHDWTSTQQYSFKVQEVTCPVIENIENCVAEGRISYQRWQNIGDGTQISDLNAAINNTTLTPVEDYITSLEKPSIGLNNYGTRIRGYVCPPITGYYTFWVAGDDNVELWLSTDDKSDGKQRIAYHSDYSGTREYTKFGSQQSSLIPLLKGKKYYIEVLHKQGGGGDGVSVRWQTPYTEIMEPIPGQYLAPYQACNSFTVKAIPEEEEILVDTKITMNVIKPEGVTSDKIYTWSVFQGGTAANLIDANGNSVTTFDGYTAWAKPSDEGEMIYKVFDKLDPTCYQFIKKKVKAVLCACKDCGENGDAIPTDLPPVTAGFGGSGRNFVVENVHLDGALGGSVAQTINYFDGLGRPTQKVSRYAGPKGEDIVTAFQYDEYEREKNKLLPFAVAGNAGNFVANAEGIAGSYYASLQSTSIKDVSIGKVFSNVTFEESPLSRVTESYAPGESGTDDPVRGSGFTQTVYKLNDATTPQIPNLKAVYESGAWVVKKILPSEFYPVNSIFITEVKDQKDNISIEYKNKSGQVICKEIGGLQTYYVYDDFDRLRCVIPPLGVAASLHTTQFNLFPASGSSSTGTDKTAWDLCFTYDYDPRGRLSRKKVPGQSNYTFLTYYLNDILKKETTPKGDELNYEYDKFNRLERKKLFATIIIENVYDEYTDEVGDGGAAFGTIDKTFKKGMLTTTKVALLNDLTKILKTTTYVNERGQVIAVASQNHLGGINYTYNKVDFIGRTLRSKQVIQNGTGVTVEQTIAYDFGGRQKAICQKVSDGNPQPYWEPVARFKYDGTGTMFQKTQGCKIQVLDYTYNLNGWMKTLNAPSNLESGKDFFGMALKYTNNGNIDSQTWRSATRKGKHTDPFAVKQLSDTYTASYKYDAQNRLNNEDLNFGTAPKYALEIPKTSGYDANGNIKTLNRTFNGTGIDRLTYNYEDGNRLKGVADAGTGDADNLYESFKETSGGAGTDDYAYDDAGNLTGDKNKGIASGGIVYNYLNLPQSITSKGISNIYDATGRKLQGITPTGKYDFLGAVVYKNDNIEFVSTPEGRVLPPNTVKQNATRYTTNYVNKDTTNVFWRYEYDLKDHLGNLRAACRCAEQIETAQIRPDIGYSPILVQQNHYDAWGMKLPLFNGYGGEPYKGLPEDRFKFLKHELVEGVGLYDLEARLYDPTLGRFIQVDPLPDDGGQESLTPYQYAWNNPTLRSDPDGRFPFPLAWPLIAGAGEYIAGSALGFAVGAVIGKNIDKIKTGLDKLAKAGMPGGEHQYANWARGLDPNKSSVSTSSSGGGGRGSAGPSNKKKGDEFEKKVTQKLKDDGHTDVAEQITIQPNPNPGDPKPKKVKLDNLSKKDDEFKLTDAKSSEEASFTGNQKEGYPLIENNGGTVVGKKAAAKGYPAGTKIPPTKVDVIRPSNLEK